MDGLPSDDDIEPYEFVPSASDPILPMNRSLLELNIPNNNYQHHHHGNYNELVDGFSRLQLSPPSLPSLYPSSIHPQERNDPSLRPFSISSPSCGHQFSLDSNSYSMRQPRWDSKFLMPSRSHSTNEVYESIVSMANKPAGCNFLKYCLSKGRPEDIALIFSMVLSDTAALMVDLHGSFLFLKLFEVCSHRQRLELFHTVTTNIDTLLSICCNDYGAIVIRKLVDYCHTREQISSLMHALGPYLSFLAKHDHGNRIVEWYLRYFSSQLGKDVLDPLLKNWEDLAKHKFGCCILQQALDLAPREDRDHVLAEIAYKAFDLVQDSIGNYLVQYVLDKRIPYITFRILQQLEGNFALLSTQKYSSNVVEKCLKYTKEAESTRIINELLQSPNIFGVLKDRYGNYVIQSALSVAKGYVHKDIVNVVMKYSASLRKNIYGRNIIEALNKRHIYH